MREQAVQSQADAQPRDERQSPKRKDGMRRTPILEGGDEREDCPKEGQELGKPAVHVCIAGRHQPIAVFFVSHGFERHRSPNQRNRSSNAGRTRVGSKAGTAIVGTNRCAPGHRGASASCAKLPDLSATAKRSVQKTGARTAIWLRGTGACKTRSIISCVEFRPRHG